MTEQQTVIIPVAVTVETAPELLPETAAEYAERYVRDALTEFTPDRHDYVQTVETDTPRVEVAP